MAGKQASNVGSPQLLSPWYQYTPDSRSVRSGAIIEFHNVDGIDGGPALLKATSRGKQVGGQDEVTQCGGGSQATVDAAGGRWVGGAELRCVLRCTYSSISGCRPGEYNPGSARWPTFAALVSAISPALSDVLQAASADGGIHGCIAVPPP